jgi:3'-5' exonuclease
MLFKKSEITNFLLLDIETVAQYKDYFLFKESKPKLAELWVEKASKYYEKHQKEMEGLTIFDEHDFIYQKYAGLYPEFGKIVSISRGIITDKNEIKIANSSENDEKTLLSNFINKISAYKNSNHKGKLFGYNINGFDIPYICRRLVINGLEIPPFINSADKKPWEVEVVDLFSFWKFGGYEGCSFDVLCEVLEIESPKNGEVKNKTLNQYYYSHKDPMKEIVKYNNADIKAMGDILLKYSF